MAGVNTVAGGGNVCAITAINHLIHEKIAANYILKFVCSGNNKRLHQAVAEDKAAAGGVEGRRLLPSVRHVQHTVDSLPGESSTFLPDKWLVDSGADLNVCFSYELFSYIGPSDIDICTLIGSTPLGLLGRGVVRGKLCRS